jgi:hypothetical protein
LRAFGRPRKVRDRPRISVNAETRRARTELGLAASDPRSPQRDERPARRHAVDWSRPPTCRSTAAASLARSASASERPGVCSARHTHCNNGTAWRGRGSPSTDSASLQNTAWKRKSPPPTRQPEWTKARAKAAHRRTPPSPDRCTRAALGRRCGHLISAAMRTSPERTNDLQRRERRPGPALPSPGLLRLDEWEPAGRLGWCPQMTNLSSGHGRPPRTRSATKPATGEPPGRLLLPDKPGHAGPVPPATGIAPIAACRAGTAGCKSALMHMQSRPWRSGTKARPRLRSLIPGDRNVAIPIVRSDMR